HDLFLQRGWFKEPNFAAHAAVVTGEKTPDNKLISHTDLVKVTTRLHERNNSRFLSYEGWARDALTSCLAAQGYPFKRATFCSAETGQLIFDPLGDVYACWEEIGQNQLRIATYDPDGVHFIPEIARQWFSRFPGSIEQCSYCPYALIHK